MKKLMIALMTVFLVSACQSKTDEVVEKPIVTNIPKEVTLDISGKNFEYNIDGQTNPTITLKQGQLVTINFTSTSGFHDFVIEKYLGGANVATEQVKAGETTSVIFTAKYAGTFKYFCSVGNHRAQGMEGTIIVENWDRETMEMEAMEDQEMNHMGCQEGEIDENGECTTADEGNKNADLFSQLDSIKVNGTDVNYYDDYTGYLATPKAEGQYPGVIMIHEWWGLNDNIKQMADLLANEGYNVLAVDLYGEVATTSDRAGELAGAVRNDPEPAIKNMQAAVDYLKEKTNSQKIASMGWCFGGQQSLNVSLAQKDLDATVIYYGHLVDDKEQLSQLSGPVLGIFGEEDSSISVESVQSFESALNEVGVENDIHIYPGVGHAFANPSGSRYAAEETQDAWNKTIEFLKENLN